MLLWRTCRISLSLFWEVKWVKISALVKINGRRGNTLPETTVQFTDPFMRQGVYKKRDWPFTKEFRQTWLILKNVLVYEVIISCLILTSRLAFKLVPIRPANCRLPYNYIPSNIALPWTDFQTTGIFGTLGAASDNNQMVANFRQKC